MPKQASLGRNTVTRCVRRHFSGTFGGHCLGANWIRRLLTACHWLPLHRRVAGAVMAEASSHSLASLSLEFSTPAAFTLSLLPPPTVCRSHPHLELCLHLQIFPLPKLRLQLALPHPQLSILTARRDLTVERQPLGGEGGGRGRRGFFSRARANQELREPV